MLKFSLNLAIVAMVVPRAKSPTTSQCTSGNLSSITPNVTIENPLLSQNISVREKNPAKNREEIIKLILIKK